MRLTWLVALVCAGCGKQEPKKADPAPVAAGSGAAQTTTAPAPVQAPAVPALAGTGERAFVTSKDGLIEVGTEGKTQMVAHADIDWCSTDARAKVVWFTAKGGLYAFDFEDRRVRSIIKGSLENITVIVNWGKEQVGGEDPVAFQAGVQLDLTGTPKLARKLGCEGDNAVYCYGDDGDPSTPTSDLQEALTRVDALTLVETTYVAGVAKRGATASLWSPPPVPPKAPRSPKVPKAQCAEEPGDCGKLTALPGSSLWLVTTANSRGDFYHETRELYDPATSEFVRFTGPALERSKKSLGEGLDWEDLRISPNGTFTALGAVFDPTKVLHGPKLEESGRSCGWANGGWRISGIREKP
ncbi:MAG: hypothetical protein H0T42_04255 [Deltaproteobacteria bacterium]|nr:hypothetical protein [Deltaproteobacteria bacterium]